MSRWLALFILVLSVVSARAACPLTGPQTVNSPYVVSGADPNCNFSFRQLGTNELTSPYPFSTSSSSVNFGFGQMVLALDNYNGFATGMVVQVTYQADPTQYIVGAIVAFDPTTGLATINAIVPNVSNIIAAGFNIQVLGGSPINGVPVWAGLGVDGTDTIANPGAAGATVSLNIDTGKTFRQNSVVYCWAPQDIGTWFLGTVISYNVATGAMSVFTTLTANTGLSYSTTFCSLIDTQGPAPALVGYSATQMSTAGSIIFPTFLPGAFVGSSGSTVIAVGNNVTFATQSGQFFPVDGQMLATCLSITNFYFSSQVQAYSGTLLVLKVTAVHNAGTCAAWSLYLDTGPTTAISQFQQNGLQVISVSNTLNICITAGSIRDSQNQIDLIVPTATCFSSGTGVALGGTISIAATTVTGTNTHFTRDFSATATLTDLNNQLTAFHLSTVSFPSIFEETGNFTFAATTAITSDTSMTIGNTLPILPGPGYQRIPPSASVQTNSGTMYFGLTISYNPTNGANTLSSSSFTKTGVPDLPPGNTAFRVFGYIGGHFDAGSNWITTTIAQPLLLGINGCTIVSRLPAGALGLRSCVTDGTSCTFGSGVSGGGSTFCPVIYNGTGWQAGSNENDAPANDNDLVEKVAA